LALFSIVCSETFAKVSNFGKGAGLEITLPSQ